jgi:UDP-glucose 4-epimerase
MHCLVTGASGFLGSYVVRELLARKHEVVLLLRPGSRTDRINDCLHRVCILRGSMDNTSELEKYLSAKPIEGVVHLAWLGVAAEDRNRVEQITYNVLHTVALWKVLSASGCRCFLGLGSQAEYGLCSGRINENTRTAPVTAYGSAKLALGVLLQRLCTIEEMRFVWLRLFAAFGPGDDERNMVPTLIRTLLARNRPRLTAGEQIWDFLYVEDAAKAICMALECKAEGFFNLASGIPCLLRQFICDVRDYIDPTLPLGFGEIPYREGQVMRLLPDITHLSAVTGWSPQISLAHGISRTVEWHMQNPSA